MKPVVGQLSPVSVFGISTIFSDRRLGSRPLNTTRRRRRRVAPGAGIARPCLSTTEKKKMDSLHDRAPTADARRRPATGLRSTHGGHGNAAPVLRPCSPARPLMISATLSGSQLLGWSMRARIDRSDTPPQRWRVSGPAVVAAARRTAPTCSHALVAAMSNTTARRGITARIATPRCCLPTR